MSNFALTCCTAALAVMIGSASWGQSNGPIEQTGASPRIQKLKQQLAADVPGAADGFWAALAREHTPIIEPAPGDSTHVLVTFIWRSQPGTKSVHVFGMEMALLPKSDIWYVTFTMLRDHRLWYSFKPVTGPGAQTPRTALPDPLNSHRFVPPAAQ